MFITKNFRTREFACPCCNKIKYDNELVDKLQILRNLIGQSVIVTSGYRCSSYNKKIKGHIKSNHLAGQAADIKVSKNKLKELDKLAKLVFYNHGVGTYSNHVHVDTGKFLRFKGTYK